MKSVNKSQYLLSGDLFHKENIHLEDGTILYRATDWENNLRERNPVIGFVEAVPEDNPLNLEIGDKVIVDHFVFFGDIGPNRTYKLQPHVKKGDKLIFPVKDTRIFFKEVNGELQCIGSNLIVEETTGIETTAGIVVEKHYKDRCRVVNGNNTFEKDMLLLVKRHSLYKIHYEGKDIVKIQDKEVIGVISEESVDAKDNFETDLTLDINPELAKMLEKVSQPEVKRSVKPWRECILVKDIEKHEPDLSGSKKKEVRAQVVEVGPDVKEFKPNDIVYRYQQGGVAFYDAVVIPLCEESIYFKILTEGGCNAN